MSHDPPPPEWAPYVRRRLASLHLSTNRESEIVDELSLHLDDRWHELIAASVSAEEATERALADFSDEHALARYMVPLRQAHAASPLVPGIAGARPVGQVVHDLRYALRALRLRPGFTAVAVLTLALGMGATTAIFSSVYGVLLKPLPFVESDRLVGLYHHARGDAATTVGQGAATYFTYRDQNHVFEDVGAWDTRHVTITGRAEPERVEALSVTDGTLPLLRVQPSRGRLFTRDDDAPRSPPRVLLTYGYWQRRFARSESALGQRLVVDGAPHEIIGVLPASFRFLATTPDVVVPMQLDRANVWVVFDFQVVARLKPGITLAQADADVARMLPSLVAWVPGFKEWQLRPNTRPLADDVIGNARPLLWTLFGTVGFVLLVACANVANLLLVRVEERQHELAVRAALGASRARMARQILAETTLLGLAGGVAGLAFARAVIALLVRWAPSGLPRVHELGLDPIVLAFALIVSLATGVVFGLMQVLRLGAPGTAALKEGGRSASDAPARHRMRNALVVAEIALTLVLLVVSGLMVRTFIALREVRPGFVGPSEVLTFRLHVPGRPAQDPRDVARLHAQIAERLQHVPGVAGVGVSSSITMDGDTNANPTIVEHTAAAGSALPPHRRFKYVGGGYSDTMGNRLVAGRHLTWDDVQQARPVVVISASLAREYWGQASAAVGKRLTNSTDLPWREIVGVIGDEHDDGLNQPPTPIVYWPMLIEKFGDGPLSVKRTMAYAVRSTRVGAPGFLGELQEAVWSIDPALPLASVRTLDDIQAESMAQTSFAMVMLILAAGVASLLGVVGIYGVIAYVVAQRTREIGIRVALGAQSADVRRLFMRHGAWLSTAGITLGVGLSLALSRSMSALLFGVVPGDLRTYVAVSAGVAVVALLATWLPARRASRVDPVTALRAGM